MPDWSWFIVSFLTNLIFFFRYHLQGVAIKNIFTKTRSLPKSSTVAGFFEKQYVLVLLKKK
jgi:hypothetical protein